MNAAELIMVTRRFGDRVVLADVSFRVPQGAVVALLGPNGAGKSTAISILLGLRRPHSGWATIFGADPRRPVTRREVGVAPQEIAFPGTLRIHELLDLVRAHFPHPLSRAELVSRFELGGIIARQAGGLSGGERRRVAVALAFAGGQQLVVLDEPSTGLDADARASVWEAIRSHASTGGAVLLTTHQPGEADALADRVVVLDRGAIRTDGAAPLVRAAAGATLVRFRRPDAPVPDTEPDGAFLRMFVPDGGAAVARLVELGVPLVDLEVRPLTLEEAIRPGVERP